MKTFLFLLPALAAGAAAPGCVTAHDCTLIGCSDGVGVVLTGLATKVATSLPVTLEVCADASCVSFRLDKTGAAPTCTGLSAGNILCAIDGQGTVVLTTVPLPTGTTGGTVVALHASAKNKGGTSLFDATQMVTIVASQPNGPDCGPACYGGEATFTP